MKRILCGLLAALGVVAVVRAAVDYTAFEQITVANSAIGLTSATIVQGSGHVQANTATCRLETAQIRYRIDGTAPTTTVGTLLEIGDSVILRGTDVLLKFSAIRTGGSSGVLDCTYSS